MCKFKYGKLPLRHSEEIIAIGDVHGEAKKLEELLIKVLPFLKNPLCHLIFTGDFCNSGENTPKVLEILMNLKIKYPDQTFFIEGNHEEMLIKTLKYSDRQWIEHTFKTMDQMITQWILHTDSIEAVKEECSRRGVLSFLEDLIPYYESDKVLITHAPLDGNVCAVHGIYHYEESEDYKNNNFFMERILWDIKWGFTDENENLDDMINKFLICGHQFQKYQKKPRLFKHRAFIDTGCGRIKNRPLTAIKFPGNVVFQVK